MSRTPDDRIQAQARAIRGMRQYRDKIADGTMTDDDVLALAAERVLNKRREPDNHSPSRERFGLYGRDTGAPLFEDPWLVGWTVEADEISATSHPHPVAYDVYAERRNGKVVRLVIDLDPTPL